ncbi:TPA: peptidase S41 [bacterium]|nr:MAG: hypothetical protein AUJ18_04670 [Candidatus Hydrogenedentes bacterium CG1_02_42_14]HBW46382.1 peptidase S41 [bacterium]
MKKYPYKNFGFIFSTVIISFLLVFQFSDHTYYSAETENLDKVLKELHIFTEAYRIVQSEYADTTKIDPNTLIAGAIEGMLKSLGDPHTHYMPPKDARELLTQTDGEFGGIGIHIGIENERLTVIAPVEGTPAWRGGVEAGDIIAKINGVATDTMSLDDAVSILRGQPGSAVAISVERYGYSEPIEIKLIREIIKVQTVRYSTIENLGYIRIAQFSERTAEELDEALEAISNAHVKGLILDLRNDPGGVLSGAIAVSNRFIDSGTIVSTMARDTRQSAVYKANPLIKINRLPLVVLVNSYSASASEIVAGCIQDHKRGIIVGTKTYGKGSVQTVENLPDGSKIALTTARYFTPSGRSIHGIGLQPDSGMFVDIPIFSDTDLKGLKELNETDVLRDFVRGKTSYTQDDLDKLASLVKSAGIALSKETLEKRLVAELERRNDNIIYLIPHLDPQLTKAIDLLKAALRLDAHESTRK